MTGSHVQRCLLAWGAAIGCLVAGDAEVYAGFPFLQNRAVGGVAIDADGVVSAPTVEDQRVLEQIRATALDAPPAALQEFTDLRAVSLKQLEAELASCRAERRPVPDQVKFLAGLLRVKYVLAYPERGDIVLAGPAEGWKLDDLGNVVGATSNRPVLMLDDLITALRSGSRSRMEPISCSIDPTAEGVQRLQQLVSSLQSIGNPERTLARIEDALGPQKISVTGVPETSRFARTMVAADFRMKRIAMKFEPAPIGGLPSFLEMVSSQGYNSSNMMPRWWLAPNYEALARTADGLAWELRGQGVKCLTEDDHFNAEGQKTATGKANPTAAKWAELFTERYEDLANHDSSFGQLRNLVDLAVVAALIEKEEMLSQTGLELPVLMEDASQDRYPAARTTSSKASFVKRGRNWIISASGGVQILPWQVASQTQTDPALASIHKQMAADVQEVWWE